MLQKRRKKKIENSNLDKLMVVAITILQVFSYALFLILIWRRTANLIRDTILNSLVNVRKKDKFHLFPLPSALILVYSLRKFNKNAPGYNFN